MKKHLLVIANVLLIIMCSALLLRGTYLKEASAQNRKIVSANQFILVDSKAVMRAGLNPAGSNEEITSFSLYDQNQKQRLRINVYGGQQPPELMVFDENGTLVTSGAMLPSQNSPLLSNAPVAQSVVGMLYQEITKLKEEVDRLSRYHN